MTQVIPGFFWFLKHTSCFLAWGPYTRCSLSLEPFLYPHPFLHPHLSHLIISITASEKPSKILQTKAPQPPGKHSLNAPRFSVVDLCQLYVHTCLLPVLEYNKECLPRRSTTAATAVLCTHIRAK